MSDEPTRVRRVTAEIPEKLHFTLMAAKAWWRKPLRALMEEALTDLATKFHEERRSSSPKSPDPES